MDPRNAWCSPEQIGPALRQWQRLWEYSTTNHQGSNIIMVGNRNSEKLEKQPEYISLRPHNKSKQEDDEYDNSNYKNNNKTEKVNTYGYTNKNTASYGRKFTGDGTNKASTYGLNHSQNLPILEQNRLIPWRKPERVYSTASYKCLHEEILDFYDYMTPTKAESHMRKQVVQRIQDVVQGLWPHAKVAVYGSFATGLYLPTSDIDLVVFGNWPDMPLWTLEDEFVKRGIANRCAIKVLANASVPIIKIIDKETDVRVDISFNQPGGVQSVSLIQGYLNAFPELKYLVLVLKQFLLQRELNEVYTGGISSYCLQCLIISFLQRNPRYMDHTRPPPNLAILLIEFFELYGCVFNYHKVAIIIRDGGRYMPKFHMTSLCKGTAPSFLCIEDPLNQDNDIGRSSYGAYQVKASFEYAYILLSRSLSRETHGQSVLGNILRVADDVTSYREWINANFAPPLSITVPMINGYSSDSAQSIDNVYSSRKTCSAVRKSYASAVAANTAQTKSRLIASRRQSQRSGSESDCPTDISSISPLSTHSGSTSNSSSLASDSDNESVSSYPSESSRPASTSKSTEHIPPTSAATCHKSVSVSAADSISSTVPPAPLKCQVSQSFNSVQHKHRTSGNSENNNSSSQPNSELSVSTSSSNTHGKAGNSKNYSHGPIQSSSRTKCGKPGGMSSQLNQSQHKANTVNASTQPIHKSNHKQSDSKRRKTTLPCSSKDNTKCGSEQASR